MDRVVLPVNKLMKAGVKVSPEKSLELSNIFRDDYMLEIKGETGKFKHYMSDLCGHDTVNFLAESFGNLHAYRTVFGNELYGADALFNLFWESESKMLGVEGVVWDNGAILLQKCTPINPPTRLHLAIDINTYNYFNYPNPLVLQEEFETKNKNKETE